jgi:hypothetical protein
LNDHGFFHYFFFFSSASKTQLSIPILRTGSGVFLEHKALSSFFVSYVHEFPFRNYSCDTSLCYVVATSILSLEVSICIQSNQQEAHQKQYVSAGQQTRAPKLSPNPYLYVQALVPFKENASAIQQLVTNTLACFPETTPGNWQPSNKQADQIRNLHIIPNAMSLNVFA